MTKFYLFKFQIKGTLGLFLGVSFLSLVELFELAIHVILILYNNKKSQKIESLEN
jgi:hypothetical protein